MTPEYPHLKNKKHRIFSSFLLFFLGNMHICMIHVYTKILTKQILSNLCTKIISLMCVPHSYRAHLYKMSWPLIYLQKSIFSSNVSTQRWKRPIITKWVGLWCDYNKHVLKQCVYPIPITAHLYKMSWPLIYLQKESPFQLPWWGCAGHFVATKWCTAKVLQMLYLEDTFTTKWQDTAAQKTPWSACWKTMLIFLTHFVVTRSRTFSTSTKPQKLCLFLFGIL